MHRAGRYSVSRDLNHEEIERAFRTLLGDHVTDSSRWADGAGDLFVSFGGESGPAYGCFVEIKRDERAPLTAMQIRFRKNHPGVHFRVSSAQEAIDLARYIRNQVKVLGMNVLGMNV